MTDSRRPVFAEMELAKRVLASLLSDETLSQMQLRAFTLMPDHLHFLAGIRRPEFTLPSLIGQFKSFSTQLYWKRSRAIITADELSVPSLSVCKSDIHQSRPLLRALADWHATLRPEVVELKHWPIVRPAFFLNKHLWQPGFYDHVIRNDQDLQDNLSYIAINPVRAGYVTQPQFYPYTGFMLDYLNVPPRSNTLHLGNSFVKTC